MSNADNTAVTLNTTIDEIINAFRRRHPGKIGVDLWQIVKGHPDYQRFPSDEIAASILRTS